MAKGDFFAINVKIDNKYDVVIPGFCDTEFIENTNRGQFGYGEGLNFVEAAEQVDKLLPFPWQAIKQPIILKDSWPLDKFDELLSNFPGLYRIDDINVLNNKNIYYDGVVVPPSNKYIRVNPSPQESGYEYTYSNTSGFYGVNCIPPIMFKTYSYEDTSGGLSYTQVYIRYAVLVAPDDFISNNIINTSNLINVSLVALDFRYYYDRNESEAKKDGRYAITLSFSSESADKQSLAFWNGAEVDVIKVDSPDPYEQGGTSTGGSGSGAGGGGDFNNTSTPVNIPSLPSVSAVSTGFISLFNPSISQLQELANYMWSELFDLDTLRKLFADPMDAILGLSIVPVSVPNGGTSLVTVGNISTGVSMTKAASQYVTVDCGTINVNEYWGAYLDYDPFTKAEIYLPYIGTHPIAVDDIMGKSVHVVYHVDILSGACCAYIQCGESVLYSFIGQCSCSIPVTGNDWTNVINGALNIAGAIGSMVATGGATAPMAVGAIASTAVNSFKPAVEKSGSISGMGGMLGIQVPYLILTRPRQALPYNQNKFIGYPSFVTATLSDLSGYTEVDSIHLEGIPATDDELSEIESLLKSGVIL